jgi:putative endonuclease
MGAKPLSRQACVYMLASRPNGTLYIGVTSNLPQRLWQHRTGLVEGFTKRYGVTRLVWYELHQSMDAAIVRERQMKKWNRAWKARLIARSNPQWNDLSGQVY